MGVPERQAVSAVAFPSLLAETIEEGQACGQFVDGNPADLAQVLWAGVHGAIALPINLARIELKSLEEIRAKTVEALLRMVQA